MNDPRPPRPRSGLRLGASAVPLLLSLLAAACGDDSSAPDRPDGGPVPDGGDPFVCLSAETQDCRGDVYWFCESDGGEFPRSRSRDCRLDEQICITDPRVGCAICQPGLPGCDEQGRPAVCNEDGTAWIPNDECDASVGEACRNGACENLCEVALEERSYLGCEFYTVDLDNAVVDSGNAAAQQYAVVVSNPGDVEVSVSVERNLARPGEPAEIETLVDALEIAPGDLETFELPAWEVDSSSTRTRCEPGETDACGGGEECLCQVNPAGEQSGCRCVVDTSSRKPCVANDPFGCPAEETCRRQPDLEFACVRSGANDGTHTALTSRAYRIRSSLPVVAYQFNPLDNVGVFSNDASLLLPTSAIGDEYTVVAWPQTLSANPGLDSPCEDSLDCNTSAGFFCDPREKLCRFGTSDGSDLSFFADLRSTLTIVGVQDATQVEVELGPNVGQVVAGGPFDCINQPGPGCGTICSDAFDCPTVPQGGMTCRPDATGEGTCQRRFVTPMSTLSFAFELNAFDVLNLETDVLNGDFTGTRVRTTDGKPVAVFTGSEASDAPRFDSYATRRCCADHLEEQLIPDRSVGDSYIIARMPPRTVALNRAFITDDSVAEVDEPEFVKVLAVSEGMTRIDTSLPAVGGVGSLSFNLTQGQSRILTVPPPSGMGTGYVPGRFDGFVLEADKPVAVLQALPSQQAVGIPNQFPGGDPAILVVPPKDQYRNEYVFLTPDLYAFDFVVITGPADAVVLLDGEPLDASNCTVSAADGRLRDPMMGDPPPTEVIRRCQLGFPNVAGGDTPDQTEVRDGEQRDGVHRIVATEPVGVIVYGFDAFVSYAYAGGYDVTILQ